jgi:hypothetical protein
MTTTRYELRLNNTLPALFEQLEVDANGVIKTQCQVYRNANGRINQDESLVGANFADVKKDGYRKMQEWA